MKFISTHKEMNFEFKTDPYILKTFIKLMSDVDHHGYFTVTDDGMSGICINSNYNICMKFKTKAELTKFKGKTTMVLSTPNINRLLKRVSRTDKLTLSDTDKEFVITSSGKKITTVSGIKKLNSQLKDFNCELNDAHSATVESKNFFVALTLIGDCDKVNIKQKGTGVVVGMCVDHIKQSVTELGDCDGQTNFESNYSLHKLLKLKGVESVSPLLTLYFRKGFPLRIVAQTNLGVIDFYVKTYVESA